MPRITRPLPRDLDPNHEQLVCELMREFGEETLAQAAMKRDDAPIPVIIEEQLPRSNRLRVYVKWARWSGIREDHRTAAILDAYERNLGPEYAKRIVIALGLTPDEANELGVQG